MLYHDLLKRENLADFDTTPKYLKMEVTYIEVRG